MRKDRVLLPFLAIALSSLSQQAFPQSPRHLVSFPKLAAGQVDYVIQENEATGMNIDTLTLPHNFTFHVAPGVKSIYWNVRTIRIDEGATFDLTAPQGKPPKPPTAPPLRQADYCGTGAAGRPGIGGTPGISGVDLTITGVVQIRNDGGLWIKTDGGPGGDAGDGQQGQQGGGHQGGIGGCDAKGGGAGGPAGTVGYGGGASTVNITYSNGSSPLLVRGTAKNCGLSTRPAATNGKAGVIAIWGGRGCDGAPGHSGANGGNG